MDFCKKCDSKDFVLWKDIFDRFPHIFECQSCGTLYEMYSGTEYLRENLPEDARNRMLRESANAC